MLDVKLTIPDKTLVALKLDAEGLADEIRLAAAVKLYEIGRLSAGAAAELAGVPLPVFLAKLAEYGVASFRMTPDELEADASRA